MDFRHYDPSLARFMMIDPMAEERNWLNPYNFVQNNPILRVDPTGLLDDYGVDQNGEITLLKKTDDETDTLYAIKKDDFGNVTKKDVNGDGKVGEGDSVTVEKGILNKVKKGEDSNGVKYNFMKVSNDKTSTNLFEFLAENTLVEWSQVKFGTSSSYISTSKNGAAEAGGSDLLYNLLEGGYTVREYIHSHSGSRRDINNPSLFGPSGFHPKDKNQGDKQIAVWLNKYYPKKGVKLKVYEPLLKKYIQYDHNSIKK